MSRALLFLPLLLLSLHAAAFRVETGAIDGARYAIALPAEWKGDVLLLAHGYRPDTAPLVADLDTADPQYEALLRRGWIVATTSYRRNGLILADAMRDLDSLRGHVAAAQGRPRRVFVQGESMGGTIGALLAERPDTGYAGVLAIGAALHIADGTNGMSLSRRPRIPLVFLANRSESEGPSRYAAQVRGGVRPVVRRVARDGHVNVNSRERADALKALVRLVEGRHEPVLVDGTRSPARRRSVARFAGGAVSGRVARANPFYGNLTLDLLSGDLARIGLSRGDRLEAVIGDTMVDALYGSDFSDVARGEWVIFIDAEDAVFVSRNWENAAASAGVREGSPVTLRRPASR